MRVLIHNNSHKEQAVRCTLYRAVYALTMAAGMAAILSPVIAVVTAS